MVGEEVLAVLHEAVDAVVAALVGYDDWGPSGFRPGQYAVDLVADRAAIDVLHRGGLRVLSEESGLDVGEGPVAVLDPIDGSTNAARRLPWFATSVCLVDGHGPVASVVHDHTGGIRFDARRGQGARRAGAALGPGSRIAGPAAPNLSDAVIGVNDVPPGHGGWAQFRALGAIALDLCAVADGRLDGYVDFASDSHRVWDYLGAMLVCVEAGIEVVDIGGRDLHTLDPSAGRTVVAAAQPLLGDLLEMRSALTATPSS